MIDVKIVLWLLTIHWIADFVLQTDWMAVNKSKNILALLAHIGFYSVALFVGFAIWCELPHDTTYRVFAFVGLTAVFHFVTDAITSTITSYLWQKEERHWFFVVIGFDQFLHYLQLILTYKWMWK
jgi:hypothetical protein